MTSVLSGGIVYEYYEQEANHYGLAFLYDNGTARLKPDYDNLQEQYDKLDVQSLQNANSSATELRAPSCDADLIQSDQFSTSFRIPSVPSGGQDLIDNGVDDPQNGRLVPVTETQVDLPVFGSNGGRLNNLAIRPLAEDESNTPNGEDTTGSTSSTTSSGPQASTTSGVGRMEQKWYPWTASVFLTLLALQLG